MANTRKYQLLAKVEDQPGVLASSLVNVANAKVQIKDPKVRAHIERNYKARKDQLDEMADFELGNYGREKWHQIEVPIYQPNQLTDEEARRNKRFTAEPLPEKPPPLPF